MPREASVGFWSDLARLIFGTQQHAAYEIEDYIRAVAVLESDRPEWGPMKGERRWISRELSHIAVVGNNAFVGILNPEDSGVVIIVDQFVNTGATELAFTRHQLPNVGLSAAIDSTVNIQTMIDTFDYAPGGLGPVGAGREIAGDAPGGSGNPGSGIVGPGPAAGPLPPLSGYPIAILRPGGVVLAENFTANSALSGFFFGRERPLYKGKRA